MWNAVSFIWWGSTLSSSPDKFSPISTCHLCPMHFEQNFIAFDIRGIVKFPISLLAFVSFSYHDHPGPNWHATPEEITLGSSKVRNLRAFYLWNMQIPPSPISPTISPSSEMRQSHFWIFYHKLRIQFAPSDFILFLKQNKMNTNIFKLRCQELHRKRHRFWRFGKKTTFWYIRMASRNPFFSSHWGFWKIGKVAGDDHVVVVVVW